MRKLTSTDAVHGVLGGGVLACGGGGWKHHGQLMGSLATSISTPLLAQVEEIPEDSWVATVTAIGAPAAQDWEIRPVDYVDALQALIAESGVPIGAVMTAQNGYSTTHNGWIQASVLGIPVLDAAGDVRAHPTGKLGGLGLGQRPGYVSIQAVSGGNRAKHGHFKSVLRGNLNTCDDVLRDISVRTGGFIASARNPVELSWVKEHAALGSISLALDLGRVMQAWNAGQPGAGKQVARVVAEFLGGEILAAGPLSHAEPLHTTGGWDHGVFRIGKHTVPYLNEYMAVNKGHTRVASYPDTIVILDALTGEGKAVKDAHPGDEVILIAAPAGGRLPVSSSAIDRVGLVEVEQILDLKLVKYLDPSLIGGTSRYYSKVGA